MLKKINNKWLVDIRPGGLRNRRLRKIFSTKAEAQRFIHWIQANSESREWNPRRKDSRHLSELVEIWHRLHGCQLKDGDSRKRLLLHACKTLGNPRAHHFNISLYSRYRSERLHSGIKPATANRELSYFLALFNELIRLKEWKGENPLEGLKAIKTEENALRFLTDDEIRSLLDALKDGRNPDTYKVAKLCLLTGARWGEAQSLTAERLLADRVVYGETKSGKVRVIPVDPAFVKEIRTRSSGRLFRNCYMAFQKGLERAGIELPKGQRTHVLRHTFASHFVMKGGNILTLQKILGHSEIRMTLRYAHLAPDHLEEARRLNPLQS